MAATSERNVRLDGSLHRSDIDWDRREPVSHAVQAALSDVEDCSAMELDPLADYVDPDALEAFFTGEPAELTGRSLTFEYNEYTVHVDGAGHVLVD